MGLIAVQVDTREPPFVQQLTFGGAPVIAAPLETGTLLVACDDGAVLAVERKSPSEFLQTLRRGRLFPQMAGLRRASPWAYLVVTGELRPGPNGACWNDGRATGWSYGAVQGALLTCQEVGVSVLFCHGELDFEATVLRLANHPRTPLRVAPPRDITIVDEREAFLAVLPGVGTARAQALLAYCGSAAWALYWLTDLDGEADDRTEDGRPLSVPGVGPGTKDRVRRLLGLHDEQVLAVIDRQVVTPPVPATATEAVREEIEA